MHIRKFEERDAKYILNWITSEKEFRMWSANQYDTYPIKPSKLIQSYDERSHKERFFSLVFEDDFGRMVGHLILRYPPKDRKTIRIGFVIVDSTLRGHGYGKQMIKEAMKYAKENLGAEHFSLGVFSNNRVALNCYKSLGFKIAERFKNGYEYYGNTWPWLEMVLN